MTEMLDVIDEEENVIDTLPRDFIVKHKLLHKSIWLIVKNSRGQVLIHQRSEAKSTNPLRWDMKVSGMVVSGESPYHACIREAEEEFSIKGVTPELLFRFHYQSQRSNDISYGYKITYDGKIVPDPAEVKAFEWIQLDMLDQVLKEREFLNSAQHIMDNYRELLR